MSRRAPVPLAALTPWGQLRAGRRPRRLVQLVAGLTLYGVSIAMIVRGGLGLPPWDVLTVGLGPAPAAELRPGGDRHVVRGAAALAAAASAARARHPAQRGADRAGRGRHAGPAVRAGPVGRPGRAAGRRDPAQRRGRGDVHRLPVRAGSARRPDDRAGTTHRPVGPAGAHRPGGHRAGHRLAARRHRRRRHRALRARYRPAGARAAAAADRGAAGGDGQRTILSAWWRSAPTRRAPPSPRRW